MGKIRRQRNKLHFKSAQERDQGGECDSQNDVNMETLQPGILFPTSGLFSSASIDVSSLSKRLTGGDGEDDRMSFVSKKSVKGDRPMKKEDKRKLRHERWLQKIDTIKSSRRKQREAKKRAETAVVGDLHPLQDALPELSEILRIGPQSSAKNERQSDVGKRSRATMKMKDRQKLQMEETARFQEVLSHSAFKSNPFATINEHLKNKLKQDQTMDET